MQLEPIQRHQFPQWKELREQVYPVLDDEFHHREMEQVFASKDWFCYFLTDQHHRILGLVELSSRNIVDGCLSSPVAYLEALVLKEEFRGQGIGKRAIELILHWCRQKRYRELATDAELSNVSAQRFYRTLGFQETDRVVAFRIDVR